MASHIGFRIFKNAPQADEEILEQFRGLPSSNINDEMNRLYCMHDYMKLLNPDSAASMVGTALTVKAPIGDNLMFHQALDMARPGDIIVVDGGSGNNRSLAGEIMLRFACQKGVAGVVVDGYLRDLDGVETLTMPVYAKGITPQGPFKNGPGEVNVPVAVGGQVVFPGDILVGDKDGIVVIRIQDAKEIAEAAIKKKASEDKSFETMKRSTKEYAEKHEASTLKRMWGKDFEVVESGYSEIYQ